jgi:hypothetical protein
MGPAAGPVAWEPTPGRHTLSLVDAAARLVDAVGFEVRGPRSLAASPQIMGASTSEIGQAVLGSFAP